MSVQDEVREYLVEQARWRGRPDELTDDYRLIDGGVLDSLGIFQLVTLIETRYNVEIDDEELVRDNFETLGAIARMVDGKAAG